MYYGHFIAYMGFNLFTSHWFSPMNTLGMDLKGHWGWSGYWVMKSCGMLVVRTVLWPEFAIFLDDFGDAFMIALADI